MNHDYNSSDRDKNFIRIEENKGRKEWVLMEDEGAGAIVRSWMPWQSQGRSTTTTIIRFYLDGAAEPVIEGNQFELFQGKGLIPFPLAHESLRSAVSFFPIPYAKRCKVTVSERPFFFQFTYREYPDETPVRTFTMDEFNAAKATIDTHANLNRLEADVIIYGGTAAAVIAAVQVKHMGKSVIVVSPDKHLGGLTAGGLGWTDVGNKSVIGGLSREFYERVWQHYSQPKAWKWQASSDYNKARVGARAMDTDHSMWIFEPSVAERIFEEYISENNIPVYRDEWLNRKTGVEKDGQRICSMTTLSGRQYQGKVFIDATYEGDLMACAGVRYHVGREANSFYDETWNGIQIGTLHHDHHFGDTKVSPYKEPGNPASGLLPRISAQDPGKKGEGDSRIQAYCFRMCLTDHPDNRITFAKPQGYDPDQYELLARIFDSGWRDVFRKFDSIPNRKTDTNNHGPFSTDNIGRNYDYPEGSYERRRAIIKEHEIYQKGLMYFLANDSKVPVDIRTRMNQWGLARDEFVDNGHWPHQLYIREARRMIGDYVTTENDVQGKRQPPKPIGKGSYTMDSHNVQRYIQPNGFVQNEGDIGVHPKKPYQIAYGSIIPKKDECENLLVPVCVSSSHIAYGSIRMEPVFMILGQSAGTAACLALDENVAVQDVDYETLRKQLLADKQRL